MIKALLVIGIGIIISLSIIAVNEWDEIKALKRQLAFAKSGLDTVQAKLDSLQVKLLTVQPKADDLRTEIPGLYYNRDNANDLKTDKDDVEDEAK